MLRRAVLANRWSKAWATLTGAFALHVLDEAMNDFLSWYNPTAVALRARLGESWFPPVFTFPKWIAGLCTAIALLASLTPLLRERRTWLIALAYLYGTIHVLNGIAHMTISASSGAIAPGAISSPVLVAAAAWLLVETDRVRRRRVPLMS